MQTFFIIWGIILVLNQAVIFGGCFAPYCIAAAIPHTSIIAFLLTFIILKSEIEEDDEKQKKIETLTTQIGLVFKDTLIITPKDITWKSKTYKFDEITRIAYSTTYSDPTNLQFGNTYIINYGDATSMTTIQTKREILYNEIYRRLSTNCENRIMDSMLKFFNNGDGRIYNNATLWDDGVTFTKKGGWFSSDTKQKFLWSELEIRFSNNNIEITTLKDNTFKLNIDNGFYNFKVLEKILKKSYSEKKAKISDILIKIESPSSEIRKMLEVEKDRFKEEVNEALKKTKETVQVESFVNKESRSYSNHIQSIENIKFEKIRKYYENLVKSNEADELQKDLAKNGRMHKALMYDTLEQFIEKLNGQSITLIDWGCEQGVGSMLVLDYIKEKQLEITVNQVILIDNDTTAINSAMVHIEALKQNDIEIITINSDDNSELKKLQNIKNNTTLNIVANDKFPVDILDINYEVLNQAYFMCVSNTNKTFIDDIYQDISAFNDIENLSLKEGKIGKFDRFEIIFKTLNTTINKQYQVPVIDIDDAKILF